jgi:serine/threonine protein kinase
VAELAATAGAAMTVMILLAGTEADGGCGSKNVTSEEDEAQKVARALRVFYSRHVLLGIGLCWLVHYTVMASCTAPRWLLSAGGLQPERDLHAPESLGAGHEVKTRDEDLGLVPLLLSAACERAPWPWHPEASLATGAGASTDLDWQPTLEDFTIISVIGRGEFGRVYQVRERTTQQVFAMKRLSKEFYLRRRMTEKATREVETLRAATGHPFVVELAHFIETSREWVVVMEFCPKGDLQHHLLNEGAPGLPLESALRLSAEVVLALEHLHVRGIVFRDLKLENVVLDKHGHAKLCDFGLAKQFEDGADAISGAARSGGAYAAFTSTFCGSYGYVAPEVSQRRQVHGFAADMYSFGILLFMLITGGEVYHNATEYPHERRLPPETLADLRAILGRLGFDFYWTSQHLLRPSNTPYRLELNLKGEAVLAVRGAAGVRRVRPDRPPNSPRGWPDDASGGAVLGIPPRFPVAAAENSDSLNRRWDMAFDLIRSLTDEQPDRRGTVATLKLHPFFAEGIHAWRTVYPRSWLVDRLKVQLLALPGFRGVIPPTTEQWLQQMPIEALALLKDDPMAQTELLDRTSPSTPTEESSVRWARWGGIQSSAVSSRPPSRASSSFSSPGQSRWQHPTTRDADLSAAARERSGGASGGRGSQAGSAYSWCTNYSSS